MDSASDHPSAAGPAGTPGPSELVISRDGRVVAASALATDLLGVAPDVEGANVTDLVTAGSAATLLDLVDRACSTQSPQRFVDQRWVPLSGDPLRVSGAVSPVKDSAGAVVAAAVTVDTAIGIEAGLQHHNAALIRDNDELRSIADELRQRTDELNVVAVFLQSVLTSLRGAVVVLDTTGAVRVWNAQAEHIWGIPRRLAMRSLIGELNLGFDLARLQPTIETGLRGDASADVPVIVTRPGHDPAPFNVSVTPLLGPGASVHGVTLLFVERPAG
jgi:PAS domain-containing protein